MMNARSTILLLAAAVALGASATGCSSGSGAGGGGTPPADASIDATQGDGASEASSTDGGGGEGGDTGPVLCKSDADCATDPKGKFCVTGDAGDKSGTCVPCLPGASDACGTGTYCAATYTCETGCKSASDCVSAGGDAGPADETGGDAGGDAGASALACDPVSHRCVGCVGDEDCPLGSLCDPTSKACVAGCNAKHPCAPGKECCGGTCFDTQKDEKNCGACGNVCPAVTNGSPTCVAGSCSLKCNAGFEDCDKSAANGCEINLGTSVDNCGACSKKCALDHATAACSSGSCVVTACDTGFDDCDKTAANGCEAPLTTLTDCGKCGAKCEFTVGVGSCATGTCLLSTCPTGFEDCDKSSANGCEANLKTGAPGLPGTIKNCGSCSTTCSVINGVPKCSDGACAVGACLGAYKDCDTKLANGCEIDSSTDVNNCGGCSKVCSSTNGTPSCSGGKCSIACKPGFEDCNKSAADGCEIDLTTDPNNCNGCGTVCAPSSTAASTVAKSACVKTGASGTSGKCVVGACAPGLFDNDGALANGCECAADAVGDTCDKANVDLGIVAVDGTKTVSGFNLTGASDVDWFKVTFTDSPTTCSFNPRLELKGDPAVRMQVYTACSATAVPSGKLSCDLAGEPATGSVDPGGFVTWEFTYRGECGTYKPIDPTAVAGAAGTDGRTLGFYNSTMVSTMWIKVFRIASATTCYPYTLTASN